MKKILIIACLVAVAVTACKRNETILDVTQTPRMELEPSAVPPGHYPGDLCKSCTQPCPIVTGLVYYCKCIWTYNPLMPGYFSKKCINGSPEEIYNELNLAIDTTYGIIKKINDISPAASPLSITDWQTLRDSSLWSTDIGREFIDLYYDMSVVNADSATINASTVSSHRTYWTGTISAYQTLIYGDSTDVPFPYTYCGTAHGMYNLYEAKTTRPQVLATIASMRTKLTTWQGLTNAQIYALYP